MLGKYPSTAQWAAVKIQSASMTEPPQRYALLMMMYACHGNWPRSAAVPPMICPITDWLSFPEVAAGRFFTQNIRVKYAKISRIQIVEFSLQICFFHKIKGLEKSQLELFL